MNENVTFGQIVKERRTALGLTQVELGRRAGCAGITVRRIEAETLRPSVQLAQLLAMALNIPDEEQLAFVRLAREDRPPSPIPAPSPLPGEIGLEDLSGRAIKGFQLGERIGSGGFGVVYKAVQPSVEREVAVKIILPRFANHPAFIRRFEAEAQIIARLEHPHIVPLYDYWREPDAAYLIMRLFSGGSLVDRLQTGPFPLDQCRRYMRQICLALDMAHRHGVVHRDIKPANMLLDEDDNVYLADFGIAKNLEQHNGASLTEGDALIGSPAYLSPEQIKADPVTPQSDMYCLGIMLFEMCAGSQPFSGPTPIAYIQQHLNDKLPRLQEFVPDLPPELDDIISRATAKKPAERYPDVLALLADWDQAASTGDGRLPITISQPAATPLTTLELTDVENPYKGLRAFTEADADNFYGRDTLIQDMLTCLAEPTELSRFLAVVGPSGSGKSSVVKAGLLPALRRGGLPNSDQWFITDFTPGRHPWEEVEAALLRIAVNPPQSLLQQLQDGRRGLLRAVRRILPEDGELILVIDQFEELFTLVEDEAVRAQFLESLVTAVLDPRSCLRVIITLRADFADRPLQYADFGDLVRRRVEFVLPLLPDELEQAITGPAAQYGIQIEPDLAATIIHDAGDQPGVLPPLQYALTELFERRDGRTLTLAAYQEIGGVTGALARRADEIYESLDDAGKAAARQIFLRLVTLGEGVEDTRRRVLQSELKALQAENGRLIHKPVLSLPKDSQLNQVIDRYGRHRLFTFDRDPATREATVEVAHEALLREWPRLCGWLDESRDDVRLQRLLAAAAGEWAAAGQEEGFLLRGSRLDQFEGWVAHTSLALTQDEQAFLAASLAARQQRKAEERARQQRELETARQLAETERARAEEQSRSAQRLRLFTIGLAVILLIAIGAAWLAVVRGREAETSLIESERSRLALQAQNAQDRGEGGDLSSLLALRSLQLGYSPEADLALQSALTQGFARQLFIGHTDDVQMVEFSPDGRQIVSSSSDGTVRLWDAQTGAEIRQFIGHEGPVFLLDFSPDGSLLATSGADRTVRLWDVQTGQQINQFSGDVLGGGIDFSSDGKRLVIGISGNIEIRAIPSGDILFQITKENEDEGFTAEFSPDDRYIVTAPVRGEVRIWDAQTGEELRQLTGHVGWVGWGAFSPDSQYILTTGQDGTARIWDVETGNELRRFVGHSDAIYNGFFSPDGQTILTGSYDKTARLWDVASGRELRRFSGHTDFVNVAFSPDGQRILTASGDRTIKLWDIYTEPEPRQLADFSLDHLQDQSAITVSADGQFVLVGRLSGEFQIINARTNETETEFNAGNVPIATQALSHDNRLVVIGNNKGLIQLWDGETGAELWQFSGHTDSISAAIFSPDDRFILTASQDGTSRLLDAETGREVKRFAGHEGGVLGAAFSPDGTSVLTGGQDMTARLWEVETGKELAQFPGHTGPVHAVAFSPDGQTITTGSEDNTARLWDIETGATLQSFVGHTDLVLRIAFSPDGRYIVTGSEDQTARLWDVETGKEAHQYAGHISSLLHVGFSQDGRYVFTADSQAAYAWRATLEDVIAFACSQLTRDFTDAERSFYGINDNAATCPETAVQVAQAEPTWTPFATSPAPLSDLSLVTEIEFVPMEVANVQMGLPVHHVYISAGPDTIMRPVSLDPEILDLPLFNSTIFISDTFEAPFRLGPFPKGEPLGFTLAEWNAAKGYGAYTLTGNRAYLDLTFENLVPNGVYTLWCAKLQIAPTFVVLDEPPCGAPDGSESRVIVDENGNGFYQLEMAPFPLSTNEVIYELALAYHSDGQTHGASVGEFGKNAHAQMIYDFMPPPAQSTPPAQVIQMEFVTDAALLQMGAPIQDVFVDIGDEQVMRLMELNAELLSQPVYAAAYEVEPSMLVEPFDIGPYAKGAPLGLTLEDWLSATGHGTYTVQGSRAILNLTFDHLIPDGLYTVWCVTIYFVPEPGFDEAPCGALDGSENTFYADETGRAEFMMEIDAFPPSTEDTFYEVAIAYHSDGQTYGFSVGEHGHNAHVQAFFDFLPPSDE